MLFRSAVREASARAFEHARSGQGPYILEMMTYRYRGHSMSDPAKYRSKEEVTKMREQHDPIDQLKEKLLLDSAKELSSWSIISSSLQCQALPLRLIGFGLTIIYVALILLILSPTLRSVGRQRTEKVVSAVHDL